MAVAIYTAPLESLSTFNSSNWYFLKYQMCLGFPKSGQIYNCAWNLSLLKSSHIRMYV